MHDIQSHEEIFAELPFAHQPRQIAVRRRDEADVRLDFLTSADPHQASALQDSEKRPLRLQRQLSDFIEEQRPSVRQLEESRLALVRSRKGSLLMSKEPTLQKFGVHAGAVECEERLSPPW